MDGGAKFECRCRETFAFFSVDIIDLEPETNRILVQYENNWQEPQWLAAEDVDGKPQYPLRPSPSRRDLATWEPKEQERVEAKARSEESEPFSFWPCTIRCIKNEFYLINFDGWNDQYNEILKKDMMRPFNDNKFLTPKLIHRDFFAYPSSIDDWMRTKPEKIMKLYQTQGCYYFEIKPDENGILLIGTKKACRKLRAWLDLLCQQQKELLMLEANMQNDKKKLEKVEKQFEDAVKCEFVISQDLIRYAIGRSGSNIQQAKSIPDIFDIKINENSKPPTVQIVGHTEEAVEQARDLLEIVRRKIEVPERQMKHLIGEKGRTINQIKRESGVRLIQSKQNYLEALRKGRARNTNRRGGSSMDVKQIEMELDENDPEEDVQGIEFIDDEPIATMVVVGTRDAVETAMGSLMLKLGHLAETDKLTATIRETKRKLTKYTHSGSGPRRDDGGRRRDDSGRRRDDSEREYERNNNSGRGRGGGRGGGRRRRERRQQRGRANGESAQNDSASSANPSVSSANPPASSANPSAVVDAAPGFDTNPSASSANPSLDENAV